MTYKLEMLRSTTQSLYWLNYRYSEDMKRDLLAFLYDVEANDSIADGPFDQESYSSGEWLRRFMEGYREKKTGRYIHTIPRRTRLNTVVDFVRSAGMITPVAFHDHSSCVKMGQAYSNLCGYDKFADQSLLCGALRGCFVATDQDDDSAQQLVLMIHLVGGEELFRVRQVSLKYKRRDDEADDKFRQRIQALDFDFYTVCDGFAATGTKYGAIFLLDGMAKDYSIDNYKWNNKKLRILSFEATPCPDNTKSLTFTLCKKPRDIKLSLAILRLVSALEEKNQAA